MQSLEETIIAVLSSEKEFTMADIMFYTDGTRKACLSTIGELSRTHNIVFNDEGLNRKYKLITSIKNLPVDTMARIKEYIKDMGDIDTYDIQREFGVTFDQANTLLTKLDASMPSIKKVITLSL